MRLLLPGLADLDLAGTDQINEEGRPLVGLLRIHVGAVQDRAEALEERRTPLPVGGAVVILGADPDFNGLPNLVGAVVHGADHRIFDRRVRNVPEAFRLRPSDSATPMTM